MTDLKNCEALRFGKGGFSFCDNLTLKLTQEEERRGTMWATDKDQYLDSYGLIFSHIGVTQRRRMFQTGERHAEKQ